MNSNLKSIWILMQMLVCWLETGRLQGAQRSFIEGILKKIPSDNDKFSLYGRIREI